VISSFRGAYSFLSNFFHAEVEMDGMSFPTVEHAYQAAKTVSPRQRAMIRECSNPGEAKRRGRVVTLRKGWNDERLQVMEDLVRQKFSRHAKLRRKLLATGDEEIEEGNWWGDKFWGVYKGEGENHLGKILMRVRYEFSQENDDATRLRRA